jgi:hypothetical protein
MASRCLCGSIRRPPAMPGQRPPAPRGCSRLLASSRRPGPRALRPRRRGRETPGPRASRLQPRQSG